MIRPNHPQIRTTRSPLQNGRADYFHFHRARLAVMCPVALQLSMATQDIGEALDAARLAAASDDYDALESAGLRLVALARRHRQEARRADAD